MTMTAIASKGARSKGAKRKQNSTIALIREQGQVLYALMMHDIKMRFFGNGLGYAVMILWPLSHMAIIIGINAGRLSPHGPSMILYAATAAIPFIAANYIGRFMMMGMMMNRTFISYPIVKPLDIMIARACLEVISNFIAVVVILTGMALIGVDIMPIDPAQAVLAWVSAILLGIGLGFFNSVLAMAFPLWNLCYVVVILFGWFTCGMAIDPETLPAPYGYIVSFNPLMHAVEWMRQAYYPDFNPRLLDKTYIWECGIGFFFLGITSERLFRAFLLNPR